MPAIAPACGIVFLRILAYIAYERQGAAAVKAWPETNAPEFTVFPNIAFEGLRPCVDAGKGDAAYVDDALPADEQDHRDHLHLPHCNDDHCDHRDIDMMAV